MYLKSRRSEECYGCFACHDICPVSAISLIIGENDFFYPFVDAARCVNCHKCVSVCPNELGKESFFQPQYAFAGINKDSGDFYKSSSGGAFKAVVKAVIQKYGSDFESFYCAGCKFGADFRVIHDVLKVNDIDDVDVFSKSKYVQSLPVSVFKNCADIITNKFNFLIFTGTPCQIAAFKSFFGSKHKNVITIDIICHGAPSQNYFDKYLKELEKQNNSRIKEFEFRTKMLLENGTSYTRSVRYKFFNGIERRLSRLDDQYLLDFYNGLYPIRTSCKHCKFKRPERVGDITIGDAWHIDKLYPEIIPTKGVSSIILNTDCAIGLKEYIFEEMNVFDMDFEFMKQNNEPLNNNKLI